MWQVDRSASVGEGISSPCSLSRLLIFQAFAPCFSGHLQRVTWYTSAGAEGEHIGTDDWPVLSPRGWNEARPMRESSRFVVLRDGSCYWMRYRGSVACIFSPTAAFACISFIRTGMRERIGGMGCLSEPLNPRISYPGTSWPRLSLRCIHIGTSGRQIQTPNCKQPPPGKHVRLYPD